MKFTQAILATFLTCGAVAAYAQAPAHAPTAAQTPAATPAPQAADASNLIGRNIQNKNNDTIGEIKSVFISPTGTVDSVMVGVGGFLGMGEREVRLAWKDLHVTDNGKKVTVDMTKDQLKALPEYKYSNNSWRGHVFNDKGVWTADQKSAADARTTTDRAAADNRAANDRTVNDRAAANNTESTGDFNASGDIAGSALIGTKVKNSNNDTVGSVDDVYVDKSGQIKTLIVSVGGFLGVGAKDVAVKWSDMKYGRDGKSLVVTTDMTKDQLKALPDYKYERRQPAGRDQATAPERTDKK